MSDPRHRELAHSDARPPTARRLFDAIWGCLSDLLGTATTAALVRRAVKRAARRCPELAGVVVHRAESDHVYTLPPELEEPRAEPIRALVGELIPLLRELTGPVVVRHLEALPIVADAHIFPEVP